MRENSNMYNNYHTVHLNNVHLIQVPTVNTICHIPHDITHSAWHSKFSAYSYAYDACYSYGATFYNWTAAYKKKNFAISYIYLIRKETPTKSKTCVILQH